MFSIVILYLQYTNTSSILSETYLSSLRFESCRIHNAESQVSPHKVTLERDPNVSDESDDLNKKIEREMIVQSEK